MIDRKLVRLVHEEVHGELRLSAFLTRFGDLGVLVLNSDMEPLWQGENILDARRWCEQQTAITVAVA